jgi:YbbR domain-containing protein
MPEWNSRFGWKVVSVLVAAGLWYALIGEIETASSIPVLVQYRNVPADLEIVSDPPDRMFMRLRGPASRLQPEDLRSVALSLDLRNANTPGDQTITITERELGLPPGVSLLRVAPSQVRITLDRRAEKLVPVEVQYSGPPPSGYRVVSQRVFPQRITILGPETSVTRVESAMTDRIDLSSTVGNSEFRVPVVMADPHLRVAGGSESVTVQVTLERIPRP